MALASRYGLCVEVWGTLRNRVTAVKDRANRRFPGPHFELRRKGPVIASTGRMMLWLLAAVAAGSAVLFVAAGWLLWSGPISLQPLVPYVRDALNSNVQGVRIDLEDTVLAWAGWERAIDVRVVGARLLDSENRVIAGVPEISLGVSGAALLGGRLAFTRIELLRPRITLFRDEQGSFGIGTDDDAGQDAGVVLSALADRLRARREAGASTELLSRVGVRDARVTLVDRVLNRTLRSTEVGISLTRDAAGISGRASGLLELDGAATSVAVRLSHVRDSGKVAVNVSVFALEPSRLATYHPSLSGLGGLGTPVDGVVDLTLSAEGIVGAVAFDLAASPGRVRLPRYFDDDLALRRLAVKGRILEGFSGVQFDDLFVDLGDASASASGSIEFGERSAVTLEGSFENLPVDALRRYWPNDFLSRSRDWVTARFSGGKIARGGVRLTVSPETRVGRGLREDALDLALDFEGVSARYLPGMPRLVDARGSMRMTGSTIALTVESGRVGDVAISEGDVRVDGLSAPEKTAHVEFVGSGEVSDVLAVLAHAPFRLFDSDRIRPETMSGSSATRVRLELPLKPGLRGREVKYAAAANLRGLAAPSFVRGHALSDGDMQIRLDANGIEASGTASIDGAPFDFEWRRAFRPAGSAAGSLSLTASLDDGHRRALGLPSLPRVAGVTPVDARIHTEGREIVGVDVAADLTSARLDVPELVWSKSAGEGATLRMAAAPSGEGGGWAASFELSGPGLKAVGEGELDADNELRRLDLSLLETGETSVSVSVRPREPEGFVVALEGRRLDMRPYVAGLFGAGNSRPIPPLMLSARIGEILIDDRRGLTDVNGRAVHSGESWREIEAEGVLTGGASVRVSLGGRSGGLRLAVDSDDAGALAKSLGVLDGIVGGRFELTATIDETLPSRPLSGKVAIYDFKVANMPVFARLLTVASLTGIANLFDGEGISFVRFEAPFDLRDGRLAIEGARAVGPALGVTLEGELDRERDRVALRGTLVPSYTLNSLLGYVPFFGRLFVGREGEGVFAIAYAVDGPTGEPEVTVNPLSALAPGFLRSFVSGDWGAADGAPPEEDSPRSE